MVKLKKLSETDLEKISSDFGEILEKEVSRVIPVKEIKDFDLDIIIHYQNSTLDVDVDLGVIPDELSEVNQNLLNEAIDEAYLKFDEYIDDNFRE